MPRKKNWKKAEAKRVVKTNSVRDERSVGCDGKGSDTQSVQACLAKDEGLAAPTGSFGPVPLTGMSDILVMPSALQGCNISDGDKARPTCLSHFDYDRQVHSRSLISAVPSDSDTCFETCLNIADACLNNPETMLDKDFVCTETMLDKAFGRRETMLDKTFGCTETMLDTTLLNHKKNAKDNSESSVVQMAEILADDVMCGYPDIILGESERETRESTKMSKSSSSNLGTVFQNKILPETAKEQVCHLNECIYTATPILNEGSRRAFSSDTYIAGSFHQGDSLFSDESRGSQCTMNALCCLIYANYSCLNARKDLDKVLLHGDTLYKRVIQELKANGVYKSRLLSFDELPNTVNVFNKEIKIVKSDVISGVCTQEFATTFLPSLFQSMHTVFQTFSNFLIMTGSVCSAVFKKGEKYFFFDSHSHDLNGLSSENGTSVLISFHHLEDLVSYLYSLYHSMNVDISAQFDLLPLSFRSQCEHAKEHVEQSASISGTKQGENIKDTQKVEAQISESNLWKTVTYKKSKKAKQHKGEASEMSRFIDCSNDDYHTVLIGKYMKDQKHRNEYKQTKKASDRREYQRLYKQKQRQSSEFQKKDRQYTLNSKRIARQSTDFQVKDREWTLKSMKSARESEEFKQKDREWTLKFMKTARESEKFKQTDRKRTLKSMKTSRESEEYKGKDRERTLKSMKTARQSEEYKGKDRERTLKSMKTARQSEEYKGKDRERTLKSMKTARESEEYKGKDRKRTLKSMKTARQSEEYKGKDRERTLKSMKTARESKEFKQKDREQTLKLMKTARESEEFKQKDRERTLKSMKTVRESEEFREKERRYEKASKRRARLVEEYRKWEAGRKQKCRTSHEFKQKETEVQRKFKRKARSDPHILEKERIAKQQWRFDERNKIHENIRDSTRKSAKRRLPAFSEVERSLAKRRKYGSDIDTCINLFQAGVSIGPLYICNCCHQTWFRHSVCEAKSLTSAQKEKYLTDVKSVDNKKWVCLTCKSSILSAKVPKVSVLNGMKWPTKPKELELYPLEERLIALRIPFMQIRELPRGRQLSIKGNVVNVPVDIQPVVNALPRPFDENVTVPVKLKKKLSFKSCVFSENIRPLRVLVALHWLMKSSDLYKNANIEIDQDWIKSVTENCNEILQEFVSQDGSSTSMSNDRVVNETYRHCKDNQKQQSEVSSAQISHDEELYDSDAEEVAHENVGNVDTLLDDANLENRNSTFTFAPGEGQQPLGIFQDKDSEYLCFPSIFCGQRRLDNEQRLVPVHYSDIAKWELRSQDRRAANSVPNIFFKLKKIQMKQLNDKVNLAVRRCQTGTNSMTASEARNSSCIDNIVRNDEGYYLFKQLRNSPAYLESRKKDVYAMIRQLGLPTWFISLSSADTRWTDLLKMLVRLNETLNYSDEEIETLSWEQKIKLVQSDPVTCSRYFDHRVQSFINIVLKSEYQPLGKITDYFYRVEFQQRGSPHIHMIVWVQNAPKFNADSNDDVIAYVDQFLTCSIVNDKVGDLINIQVHKHSRTCRKKEDRTCRFGYPLPPLPKTMVLDPLETDKDKFYKLYQTLQKRMNNEKDGYNMSYEEFLKTVVQMSEEDYIKCIRSSLNSSKVFLKRNPNEIRVNLYNNAVLKAWKANIDIQFVLDPYACAMYIVSYISKSQRGMSNLLHAAAKEARSGNLDIKRQVRHIGNVFSNSVEVSAQEAVYLVLQMPLTKSTRDVVFINTSTPGQRVQLLKPKSVLDELPADSTNIMSDNIIKRYSKRPKSLENYCLADYVSQLEVIYPETSVESQNVEDNDAAKSADDCDDGYFDDTLTVLTLKNGIKIKRRCNSRIIRYLRFNIKTDAENHYREKILLFFPWRNENNDLLRDFSTYKDHYESIKDLIDNKCLIYEHHVEELELARDLADAEYDAYDEIAPGTRQVEADTAEEETVESETFVYFNPDRASEHRECDIGIDIGCSVSSSQIITNDNVLSDEEYRALLRCLNRKQKEFYNHVVHWIKTKDAPLYAFLSGGAGVGKSVVIRALYQTLFRVLNLREGENADDIRVLLCAYTGKVAFNINGSTISSAFKQKYKQADQTLTCDSLNTFRSKYRNLSVVIIDEISMVSNIMLNFINQRLQELKGTRTPFGGISIIAVGDLFQLKPVSGDWIFNDMKRDAAALSVNLWKEYFSMFELTEIMRQKDDIKFAELLNRLRHNSLTVDDRKVLKLCEIDSSAESYQLSSPHLFAENYYMHGFNETIINSLNAQKVVIECHDSVLSPKLSKEKQDEAIKRLPTDPNKTANLHCSLIVVIGMIYDLTVNTNTEDGLANGASCVVKFIEYKQAETNRPSVIWVQFDDLKAGHDTRLKYKNRGFYHNQINNSWTPIFDIERSFTYNRKTFERVQFPLQPSAGRSVHRAQGSTLESVVIDLSQRRTRKVPHLHYVALSRVKSSKNLQILNFNEQALTVDEQVQTEMERLHGSSTLKLCYVPMECIDSNLHFKVAFNNCRSLNKHFCDIKHDTGLLSSHIFGLAETRLHQYDNDADYNLDGYYLIRNDQTTGSNSKRPPHGLAVYIKHDLVITSQKSFSSANLEFVIIDLNHGLQEVQIVMLYKSPKMSDSDLRSVLRDELFPYLIQSKSLVVLGDFNIDVSRNAGSIIQYLCDKFACRLLLNQPTTDNQTTLDLVFSNMDGTVGTVENYWSDHKVVFFYSK